MIGRILLVEDDPRMARVLRDNLRVEGFEVVLARSGAAALQEARQSTPDLILLDLMLPDTDGYQLCGALRRTGRVPIIILTARGEKTNLLRGLDSAADDYVTKPFDVQELLARVGAVLRRVRPAVVPAAAGCYTARRVLFDAARREMIFRDRPGFRQQNRMRP